MALDLTKFKPVSSTNQNNTSGGLDLSSFKPSGSTTTPPNVSVKAATEGLYGNQQSQSFMQKVAGIAGNVTGISGAAKAVPALGEMAISSEKGLAQDITAAYGPASLTVDQAAQAAQQSGKLIKMAQSLPQGDPRRDQYMKMAAQINAMTSGQAAEQLKNMPSVGKVIWDIIGTAADVLSAGTYGAATESMKAGELAIKEAAPSLVKPAEQLGAKVSEVTGKTVTKLEEEAAARASKKASAKILEDVSPKLAKKGGSEAIRKTGTETVGAGKKIVLKADKYLTDVADTVKKYVPDFKPGGSAAENLNKTREAVYKMAADLKQKVIESGKDSIYSFRELSSKMRAVEKPIAIKSDTVLEKQFKLAQDAALKVAKKSGGTISGLLDARKEFDTLVEREFPTLYDKVNAPMRNAITSMRNVMNDFIEQHLPQEVGYLDSLKNQSRLLTAVDNMSEKAYSELGTTGLERFGAKHPIMTKGAKAAAVGAAGALGAGGVYEAGKTILGQ